MDQPLIQQRRFTSNVTVSQLILGTMRLPTSATIIELGDLLCSLHERGIDTHHSSSEYDTFPRYIKALRLATKRGYQFKHVVKLAEPSWDDLGFSGERFHDAVRSEAEQLGTDRIDVVQWMVRTKHPDNDHVRLPLLRRDQLEITAAFHQAKSQGLIGSVACFGYTDRFLIEAAGLGLIDGITGYYNPAEPNEGMFALGLPILAIRPFGGGGLISAETSAADLLRFAAKRRQVLAIIVGISSTARANEICEALVTPAS